MLSAIVTQVWLDLLWNKHHLFEIPCTQQLIHVLTKLKPSRRELPDSAV